MSYILEKLQFAALRRWFLYFSRKRAVILTLHRTTSKTVWEMKYNNPPEYLYKIFQLMKQRGFHFYTIDEVMSDKPLKQPAATIACDDGFADNLYEAVPVFRKFEIPYCIYLPASIVLREDVTLEAIAEYMMKNPGWKYDGINRGITAEEDRSAFEAAINIVRNAETLKDIHKTKANFMKENNTSLKAEIDSLYLDKKQIRMMAQDPLCTFGVHSYYHAPMRRMSDKELIFNTRVAKQVLEKIVGRPLSHFAYPFGGFNDNYFREFKAVKSAGFVSGAMFWDGVLTEKFKRHGYMIPRIQINPYNSPEENVKIYERLLKVR